LLKQEEPLPVTLLDTDYYLVGLRTRKAQPSQAITYALETQLSSQLAQLFDGA
jgi:hypothetical protein